MLHEERLVQHGLRIRAPPSLRRKWRAARGSSQPVIGTCHGFGEFASVSPLLTLSAF